MQIEVTRKAPPPRPPEPIESVKLTLSEREAQLIYELIGRTGGTYDLYEKLGRALGVTSGAVKIIDDARSGVIVLKEGRWNG